MASVLEANQTLLAADATHRAPGRAQRGRLNLIGGRAVRTDDQHRRIKATPGSGPDASKRPLTDRKPCRRVGARRPRCGASAGRRLPGWAEMPRAAIKRRIDARRGRGSEQHVVQFENVGLALRTGAGGPARPHASASSRIRSSSSPGRPAPARPRCCGCCSCRCGRRAGWSRCSATTSRPSARTRCRRCAGASASCSRISGCSIT